MIDRDLLEHIWFTLLPRVGPRTQQQLLRRFGSPERVRRASVEELRTVPGVGPKLARTIAGSQSLGKAEEELELCRSRRITPLVRGSDAYPALLAEIPDPPSVLYVRGVVAVCHRPAVAIVGSRNCTSYGLRLARELAAGLVAAGYVVVSGLARGIDHAAHAGTLEAGGTTIAVAATGMETIYPPEHLELSEEIVRSGALVTECQFRQSPLPGLFPQRNRIISGLCVGVIVVEAQAKSGALYTAEHATEQNREVFAVPGMITSRASDGPNQLIQQGARLILSIDDVLSELPGQADNGRVPVPPASNESKPVPPNVERNPAPQPTTAAAAKAIELSADEKSVYAAVGLEPQHVDTVLSQTELPHAKALAALTMLELKQAVERHPGSLLSRNPAIAAG